MPLYNWPQMIHIVIIILYLMAFILAFKIDLSLLLNSFLGGSDSTIYVWLTWQNIADFGQLTVPIFYPLTNTLAFSDNYLLPSFVSKLVLAISSNFFLVYNVPLIAAAVLNGYCTFILVRFILGSCGPAFLAGLAFMLSPYFYSHAIHPQLQFAFFIPLAIYFTLRHLKERSALSGLYIGIIPVITFLVSIYYAIFIILVEALMLGANLFLRAFDFNRKDWLRLVIINLPTLVLLYILTGPYRQVAQDFGTRRLSNVEAAVTWGSFAASGANNTIWGFTSVLSGLETRFFPGITVLVLCLIGIFGSVESSQIRATRLLVIIVIVCCLVLAIGPGHTSMQFIWPYTWLYYIFPGFSALRACGRLALITYLGIAVLAAFGLTRLTRSLSERASSAMIVLCCLTTTIELSNRSYPNFRTEVGIPTAWTQIFSRSNSRVPVVVLPYPRFEKNEGEFARIQTEVMQLFRESNVNLVNGYGGIIPKFHRKLYRDLAEFPNEASLRTLSNISGLQYAVVLARYGSQADNERLAIKLTNNTDIEIVDQTLGGDYLLRLRSKR